MRVLALDVATTTGWAYRLPGGLVASGFVDFGAGCAKTPTTVRHPQLLLAAACFFRSCIAESGADTVMIEAGFARGGAATRLLQRLIGIAMAEAQAGNCAVVSVGPKVWRKEIFGKGGLDSEAAKAAAIARTGIADDNEAEARCILEYTERVAVPALPKPVRRRAA